MSNIAQGSHEDVLKIVGRAVLTLHLHGESLSSDKVVSMIGCYAENAEQNQQPLFALAMEMMTAQKWAKSA
ncbi:MULTISPECIES: hypothetical protein [Pantoea]|uniref:hypothetical protein n=1 Tax=Pantoea TaxID=53335 RepID=UPI002892DA7F|nr:MULTISPECIES: hypothetical protein [unclassified Pantoea]MCG7388006.1 hypothetical protein [Pantoea sp. ACRSB]